MAPEVANDDEVNARSDVYGLGAVMFFMLTGEQLFPHKTIGETVLLQIGKTPDTPSERLGRPVPADLERIVMRCLAKSPADRYANAAELEADLAKCRDAGRWSSDDARIAWMGVRSSMKLSLDRLAG
jgi:serine/threonine-protein kinase